MLNFYYFRPTFNFLSSNCTSSLRKGASYLGRIEYPPKKGIVREGLLDARYGGRDIFLDERNNVDSHIAPVLIPTGSVGGLR